jgi:dTDP-4-dehydrorhamnose reductase
MKVIVTGGSGMLGRAVMKVLHEFSPIGTCFSNPRDNLVGLNLGDKAQLISLLDSHNPDVVVHCAAIRFPDKCQEYTEELRNINVNSAGWIAEWCKSKDAYMVHISSDAVFDGNNPPYTEVSPTGPINIYGQTKLDAENLVISSACSSSILRLPVLFSFHQLSSKESSMTIFIPSVLKGERVQLDDWALRYPTAVEDCAKAVKLLIDRRARGVFNFSAQAQCTKYSTGVKVCELRGLDTGNLVRVEGAGDVPRAKDARLTTSEIFEEVRCVEFYDALPELISQFGASQ